MIELHPATLERHGVRLEPLTRRAPRRARRRRRRRRAVAAVVHLGPGARRDADLHRRPRSPASATGTCCRGWCATLAPARSSAPRATTTSCRASTASRSATPGTPRAGSARHVNTACKLLLLEHAFETVGCKVVGLRTDNFNFASQRAIEALGAKKDGVLRHHAARRDGTVRDTVLYSILAGEWPDVKRHLELRLARRRAQRLSAAAPEPSPAGRSLPSIACRPCRRSPRTSAAS